MTFGEIYSSFKFSPSNNVIFTIALNKKAGAQKDLFQIHPPNKVASNCTHARTLAQSASKIHWWFPLGDMVMVLAATALDDEDDD